MSKLKMSYVLFITLFSGIALQLCSQTVSAAANEEVDKLISVIKSDAPHKEKADACRRLAVVGTKDAVVPLAVKAALNGNLDLLSCGVCATIQFDESTHASFFYRNRT